LLWPSSQSAPFKAVFVFDLVTPHFASKVICDLISDSAGEDRMRFVACPGGHIFYALNASPTVLREEARVAVEED
jgi:hypothetical protein